MPHEPWIMVWTHGSDIVSRGGDKVQHLSLDVEQLNEIQFKKMQLADVPSADKQYEVAYDKGHTVVPSGGHYHNVYHVSGTVTEKNEAPKEFGMKNLVAIAVLDFADILPKETKRDLIALLRLWIENLEKPQPMSGAPIPAV